MKTDYASGSPKPKGKGAVRSLTIAKAKNGHTMRVDREGEYDSTPAVYGAGQHPQMFADAQKALGLPSPKKVGAKPAAKPAGSPIANQMLRENC